MTRRLVCFVPSDRPVGGIAKLLDYAVHGARHNFDTVFCMQNIEIGLDESTLFAKPYFEKYGAGIDLCSAAEFEPRADDIALFTLPSSHFVLCGLYEAAGFRPPTFIHLLQNVRVANTAFDNGYSYRLLSKPLHRICITQEVLDAVAPLVEGDAPLTLIPHGFDFDVFARAPRRGDPVMIGFNTFKGNFGHEVVDPLKEHPGIDRIVVSQRGIDWHQLQRNYKRSTIFLSTPLPEEGLYLPGLEAMAAGNLVLTPDAFGNRFYCDFDDNCCLVPYEDVEAYRARLKWAIEHWDGAVFEMRQKAYRRAADLGMQGEYTRFCNELERYRQPEEAA